MNIGNILNGDSRLGIHEEKHSSVLKCLLIYTGCFIVLSFFVYFLFIINEKTLIRYLSNHIIDSFAQKYAFAFEFKRFMNTLFQNGEINTWDWSIGLGSDGYIFNISSMLSPSEYIVYLTPGKYVDVVYSLLVVFRIYLSGTAFILFAKKIGLNDCQSVMGGIAYSFCPWIIVSSMYQGAFIKTTMMFPIIMLGEEKIMKRESPMLFILSVGYTVFSIVSFAYMIALVTLLYFPIRMATDGEHRSVDTVVRTTVLFIMSGIAGILIASESLAMTMLKYSETSSSTGRASVLLWDITTYLRLPMKLLTWDMIFGSTSIIGIAAIGVVMVPLIAYKAFRRETNAIMTVLMFIFAFIPFFSSVFNYFAYPTGRWMFMLLFFYALAAAECFDKELLMKRESKIAITVVFAMYVAYIAWIQKINEDRMKIVLLFSCIICALIIALIWIYFRPSMDSAVKQRTAGILVIATMCIGIVFNHNMMFFPEYEYYLNAGQGQTEMNRSSQRAAQMIEDDSFYRVDQAKPDKVNRQIYFGNRSEYAFYSYLDVGWFELNKLLGNNQGYYLRVFVRSNDNRFGLDFLQGVKYFLGNHDDKDNLSRYAGFGFEPYKTLDGVEVLKNKYNIGLGCVYDAYIRRSEWEKLTFADREYAMLMGVVVPDDEEMPSGMRELKVSDINTGVEKVPYNLRVSKDKTQFVVDCDNDEMHQLLMTIKNVNAEGDTKITLNVRNKNIKKSISNTRGNERGFPEEEMRDLTVNLGCGKEAGTGIRVRMNGDEEAMESGMTFDDVEIYSMPAKTYQECAEKLVDNRFKVTKFMNDHITGTVSAEKAGVLYLSVFDNNGWDVYVDGKKAKIRDEMDVAFIGVDIEPGEHEIEMKYHTKGVIGGFVATVAGMILTLIIMLVWKKQSAAKPSV